MSATIAVVQTSAVGVGVALDIVGTSGFQQVKLVGGAVGVTAPIEATTADPATGAVAMVVREAGTVTVTGAVAVTGGVTVVGSVNISGVVPVSTIWHTTSAIPVALHEQAEITVRQDAAETWNVRVSGPVSLLDVGVTSATTPAVSSTGLIVVVKPGLTIGTVLGTQVVTIAQTSVSISAIPTVNTVVAVSGVTAVSVVSSIVTILGTQVVTIAQTSVSVAVVPTVNTLVTLLGTVAVNVVAGGAGGGSVTTGVPNITATGQLMWVVGGQSTTANPIFVSQINAPAAGGGSVTTAVPSISATGQVMWVAGGQSTTANPIFVSQINAPAAGGGSVSTTQASGVTGQLMWLAASQTLTSVATVATVSTLLGTVAVNIVAGAAGGGSVTTTQASGVTGQLVWMAASQTLTSVATVGTIVTQLGTQVVTIAQTSVSVASIPTVNTVVAVSGVTAVSVVSSIVTILGTQVVTIAQTSVSVAVVPTVSTVVTVLGTLNVTVVGGVVVATTTQASGVTGALNYLAASQTVFVTDPRMLYTAGGAVANSSTGLIVMPKYNQATPFLLFVSSTVGGSVGTTLLFTVWTGSSLAGAGLTQWAVPAGNVLRLQNVQCIINSSAVTGGTFQIMVNAATASASFTSGSQGTIGRPIMLQMIVSAGVTAAGVDSLQADIVGGTTIGVRNTAATAMVIANAIIQGYLFD